MIKAIPTKYRGILFRSKLEASYAKTLDALDLVWTYETNGFYLGKTTKYLPDFWLPQIKTFIEVKGPFVPGAEKATELARKVGDDWWDSDTIVIVCNEQGLMKMAEGADEVALLQCVSCDRFWFASFSRSYKCRNCGTHDGDHHIKKSHARLDLLQVHI